MGGRVITTRFIGWFGIEFFRVFGECLRSLVVFEMKTRFFLLWFAIFIFVAVDLVVFCFTLSFVLVDL